MSHFLGHFLNQPAGLLQIQSHLSNNLFHLLLKTWDKLWAAAFTYLIIRGHRSLDDIGASYGLDLLAGIQIDMAEGGSVAFPGILNIYGKDISLRLQSGRKAGYSIQ